MVLVVYIRAVHVKKPSINSFFDMNPPSFREYCSAGAYFRLVKSEMLTSVSQVSAYTKYITLVNPLIKSIFVCRKLTIVQYPVFYMPHTLARHKNNVFETKNITKMLIFIFAGYYLHKAIDTVYLALIIFFHGKYLLVRIINLQGGVET